jgi:predicted Zn-dependent protease
MKGMKRQINVSLAIVAVAIVVTMSGCKKGLNFFSIQDDKDFGAQMEAEIAASPQEYPLLSQSQYPSAYAYLENMKQQILASGKLDHANDFEWKLYIVNDPTVQNAFCTPGGYIYVYTGLIKYLDKASALAGVLGHEMAHADKRHSTKQMTEQYGLSLMFSIIAGTTGQAQLTELVANLSSLAFSRADEKEADTHSVIYLCPTQYRANGAADFFEKIVASGGQQVPAFLSTHPNPDNRVDNIKAKSTELSCGGNPTTQVEDLDYLAFKNSLP